MIQLFIDLDKLFVASCNPLLPLVLPSSSLAAFNMPSTYARPPDKNGQMARAPVVAVVVVSAVEVCV